MAVTPVNRNRREIKFDIPGRYLLLFVTVFCIGLILITYNTDILTGPINRVAGVTIVPFQNGISKIGTFLVDQQQLLADMEQLQEENAQLRKENEALQTENSNLQQDHTALQELRSLYALDGDYSDYNKTGASVISKDAGNWYHSFVIDKGTDDGLAVDMNVLAGAGLAGRIISIGPNWARVQSIIDDNANVAGTVLKTQDNLIVSGSLSLYQDGVIAYTRLMDPGSEVSVGDRVVTSNISDKYLPGILIGYISELSSDSNNLTKSGTLTPAVDFAHLNTVLVITDLKQTVTEE